MKISFNAIKLIAFACCAMAGVGPMTAAENELQRIVVAVPPGSAEAPKIRLIIEGVSAPGNQPFKLRVTTTNEAGKGVFLGSAGVEAVSRNESKTRRLPPIRMDVTRALKRMLANRAITTNAEIAIQAVDGKNNPIPNLTWSVEAARIETQAK